MTTTVRPYLCVGFLLAGLVICSGLVFSQAPKTPTQTPPSTVRLSLLVTDEKDRSVEDVIKDEIRLIEDGQPQVISLFEKDTRPTRSVIAVDNTGSFLGLFDPALDFVRLIIRGMRANDEIQLLKFVSGNKIVKLNDFTSERSKLADSLKLFRIEGGQSAVIDAVYEAVRSVASYRHSESIRRAVVLISDGEDRASRYTTTALVKLLRETDVQLFVVGIVLNLENEGGLIRPSPRQRAETFLKTVAAESGGRVFFPRTNGDLVQAANEINRNLQSSYVVTFHPENVSKKEFRKISISVQRRGLELKAITRPGYRLKSDRDR